MLRGLRYIFFLGWILVSYDPGYGYFTLELNGQIVLEKVKADTLEKITEDNLFWYKLYNLDNVPYGQNTARCKAAEDNGVLWSEWSKPLEFNNLSPVENLRITF